MKKSVCIILALVLCFSLVPAGFADTAPFSDDPKAIQAASNSVVMLSCYDKDGDLFATGSAFAAFEEGAFVTNFHVIEGAYSIRAQMETGLEFRITSVIAYDTEKDIAILRTDAKTGLEPLPLGDSSKLERVEKVIAIGSPLGLINTISIGLYSGIIKDDGVFLQFSAPISQGSSGGALFNNHGEVVGITSASYTRGQNLNLAIPIDDVKILYESEAANKQQQLKDFYESFEHAPHIQVYTVEYVKEHCDELNGHSISVQGYIYYLDEELMLVALANDLQSVDKSQSTKDNDSSYSDVLKQVQRYRSSAWMITAYYDTTDKELLTSALNEDAPIFISGILSVGQSESDLKYFLKDPVFYK